MEPLNNVEGLKEQNEGILSLDENENYCNCLLEIQQWRLRNLKKERKRHLKHKCINKKRNGKTRRELFSNVDIPLDDEWSTSFEENGPKVEEVLKDCANLDLGDLNYYLREIKVEESIAEMPNEKMELVYEDMFTDNVDKTEEDNLSKMSGDDLEKSIVDLVLDLENEIATENTNAMKAPIGFDLEEDVFPEVQRLVLKYGSLNPLLNGSTPESSLHNIFSEDSDEAEANGIEKPNKCIILLHCDVLQYIQALEAHFELDDNLTVKFLLKSLGSAEISVDCLIELHEEILEVLYKALGSSNQDVVLSAKQARDNWMAMLSQYESVPAKIAYLKFWFTDS